MDAAQGIPLSSFPQDVLASITSHLTSTSLLRLCIGGDPRLNARFETGGVVHVCYQPYILGHVAQPIKVPSFVRSFRQLRSLHIIGRTLNTNLSVAAIIAPTLDLQSLKGLSEFLTTIIFEIASINYPLATPPGLQDLYTWYPRLTCLKGFPLNQLADVSAHSNRLKRLELFEWDSNDDATRSLDSLEQLCITQRFKFPSMIEKAPVPLPTTLTSLDMGDCGCQQSDSHFINYINAGLPSLFHAPFAWPPHLRELRISSSFALASGFGRFPSTLESLSLTEFFTVDDESWTSQLPRSLRTLICERIPATDEVMQGLPRSLTHISKVVCTSNESPLEYLPPGLTYMRLMATAIFEGDCLPKGLKVLTLEPPPPRAGQQNWKISELPSSITEINCAASVINIPHLIDWTPSVPVSSDDEPLSDISDDLDEDPEDFNTLDESRDKLADLELCEPKQKPVLPITTASLLFCAVQPFLLTLPYLPPTITKLCLDFRCRDLDEEWLTWLPRSLIEFYYAGFLNDSNLKIAKEAQDGFSAPHAPGTQDEFEPTLPASLRVLRFHSPSSAYYNITSASLQYLPRYLLHLRIDLRSLSANDLATLPPTIASCVISAPSHGEPPLTVPIEGLTALPTHLHYVYLGWQIVNLAEVQRAFKPREFLALNPPMQARHALPKAPLRRDFLASIASSKKN